MSLTSNPRPETMSLLVVCLLFRIRSINNKAMQKRPYRTQDAL